MKWNVVRDGEDLKSGNEELRGEVVRFGSRDSTVAYATVDRRRGCVGFWVDGRETLFPLFWGRLDGQEKSGAGEYWLDWAGSRPVVEYNAQAL